MRGGPSITDICEKKILSFCESFKLGMSEEEPANPCHFEPESFPPGLLENDVAAWMKEQANNETARIQQAGSRVLGVGVKNFCTMLSEPDKQTHATSAPQSNDTKKITSQLSKSNVKSDASSSEASASAINGNISNVSLSSNGKEPIGEKIEDQSTGRSAPTPHFNIINRIELCTTFDFDRVTQILLSDPIPCTPKPNFMYCNVILLTDKPLPLMVPYIYKKDSRNTLCHWCFVNAEGKESRHTVNEFEKLEQ